MTFALVYNKIQNEDNTMKHTVKRIRNLLGCPKLANRYQL